MTPTRQLVTHAKDLLGHAKETRVARALTRYGLANGALLSGGITYRAIFSLFAALTIGFTVFMRFLGSNDDLKSQVIASVNKAVPGLIAAPGTSDGLLQLDDLVMSSTLTWPTVIAGLVLLWSVITAMDALRSSVRVMFSLPPRGDSAVKAKLASFLGFIIVVLAVLLSAIATTVLNGATHFLDGFLDLGGFGSALTTIGTYVVSFGLDMLTFYLVVRVLSGVQIGRRDMLLGAAVSAAGFLIIRTLGTSIVVGSASRNAVFATAAVLVTILVWLYLCARILLTACAIAADPPGPLLERLASEEAARARLEAARAIPDDLGSQPAHLAEVADREKRLARRFALPAAALISGWVLGRRSGRRSQSDNDSVR